MPNFRDETLEALEDNGRMPEDITFIGTKDGKKSCTWLEFLELADFVYDNGYGGNEITSQLVIEFNEGMMFRGEYDGSEWWEFLHIPQYRTTTQLTIDDIYEECYY